MKPASSSPRGFQLLGPSKTTEARHPLVDAREVPPAESFQSTREQHGPLDFHADTTARGWWAAAEAGTLATGVRTTRRPLESTARTRYELTMRAALVSCSVAFCACASIAARDLPTGTSAQLLVVRSPSWESTRGELRRYRRASAGWQQLGDPIAVNLGKNGLGWGRGLHGGPLGTPEKREGDGRAPAGVFALGPAFGIATAAPGGSALSWLQASATLECVDDPGSPHYNQILDSSQVSRRDWTSSELLRRPDELYDLALVVQHNQSPAQAGAGSCIFLHVWKAERPTVGCTSMERESLSALLGWLDPAALPRLVQLPEAEYQRLREPWHLP